MGHVLRLGAVGAAMPLTPSAVRDLHVAIVEVCPDFCRLAGVPDIFEGRPVHKKIFFHDTITNWLFPSEENDEVDKRLSTIRNTVTNLHKQLDDLDQFFRQSVPNFNGQLTFRSSAINVPPELKQLSDAGLLNLHLVLKHVSEWESLLAFSSPPRLGRPRGNEAYPRVGELVYLLEFRARYVGGSFTAHRKLGQPKGSLIQALDRLRDRLKANADLAYLANLIPPTEEHPVPVYETALRRARKDAVPWRRPPNPDIE
jgi:hypothetical protein